MILGLIKRFRLRDHHVTVIGKEIVPFVTEQILFYRRPKCNRLALGDAIEINWIHSSRTPITIFKEDIKWYFTVQ